MAEWLGRGLQNLVQRFESASDLQKSRADDLKKSSVLFWSFVCEQAHANLPNNTSLAAMLCKRERTAHLKRRLRR